MYVTLFCIFQVSYKCVIILSHLKNKKKKKKQTNKKIIFMPKWNILGRSVLNPSINLNISVLVFSLTKENCPLIVMNFILKHIKCLTCGWHYYYLQHQHSQATALLKMYLKNHISQAENIFEKQ